MLQNIVNDMTGLEARLHSIVPKGYAMAVNVRCFTPEFLLSTYPAEWVLIYAKKRYALFDPVTVWSRFNDGTIRWSEIDTGMTRGVGRLVLEHAARFGLHYGGGVSMRTGTGQGIKSMLFGAREDRELTDRELEDLAAILRAITDAVGAHAGLSDVELEALRDLAAGLTHNEIADLRSISPATVKKRIERAREVLGARNSVQAVAIATKRGLILDQPTY